MERARSTKCGPAISMLQVRRWDIQHRVTHAVNAAYPCMLTLRVNETAHLASHVFCSHDVPARRAEYV
eukprot:30923-Eustigmatos_ZCMA.PRE.1